MFRREWRKKSFLTPEKTPQPLRKIVRNWGLNLRAEEECELPIYSHQLMLSIYMIRDRRNVFDVLRDTVQRIMIWIIISLLLKKCESYLLWPCSSSNSPSIKISFQIRTLSWLYQANWPMSDWLREDQNGTVQNSQYALLLFSNPWSAGGYSWAIC